ncbi:DUF6086 family protein [Streptomyces sp. NBC_01217]|uniref:DUF6086 family protein n=1 Tax=Streptomyces sp. NBC_01217 TaxID=2903779 RepID=UPI002E1357B2|nr:hypothetical protein OG507_12220 [Streptomyces sp. NBC_01217]
MGDEHLGGGVRASAVGELPSGLLITSLVLLERAGASVTLKPEHEETLREEKAAFVRAMG